MKDESNLLQPVQRTLVVTHGATAVQTGQLFQTRLTERDGPAAVTAIVDLAEDDLPGAPADEGLTAAGQEALQAALTRISPISVAAELADRGYALDSAPEIHVFLLLDVAPGADNTALLLAEAVSAVVHAHLGLEAACLLIWLCGDPADTAVHPCLAGSAANHYLFPRGILALSPLNEAGLRLSDDTALAARCADALWLLTATPLRASLEWLADQEGDVSLNTLGVGVWEWPRELACRLLRQRWLAEVLRQWLAAPAAGNKPDESAEADALAAERPSVADWLARNSLRAHELKAVGLAGSADRVPDYEAAAWAAPWPWDIPGHFVRMTAVDNGDESKQPQRREWADLQHDAPLLDARQAMHAYLRQLLDDRPVGGVGRACRWAAALAQACNEQREALYQEMDEQTQADAALATLRGELEARRQTLLETWPNRAYAPWLRLGLSPWRWPRLGWHYWQLRGIGQQLALVYHHQAARRRQQAANAAAVQACGELEQTARQIGRQVEEVGEMLAYLLRQQEAESREDVDLFEFDSLMSLLWANLVEDAALEALAAAQAAGGLGQQLAALDDVPLMACLQRLADERMRALWRYTAVSLVQQLHAPADDFARWWQRLWEEAAPLWRHDPARLPERLRARELTLTLLCAADASALAPPYAALLPEDVRYAHAADRTRIYLLRARGGLTADAMTREGRLS